MNSYLLDARSVDLAFEVRVNDWLVASSMGERRSMFAQLTNIQIDGNNRIAVSVSLPAGVELVSPNAEMSVRIRRSLEAVYVFEWRTGSSPAALPINVGAEFASDIAFGEWGWQRAAEVALDADTMVGVVALVGVLHDALDNRQLDNIVSLFKLRDTERAIAQGDSVEQESEAARQDYSESIQDPDWRMQPLNPEQFRYRLMADSRVVHVTDVRGYDVLMSAPNRAGSMVSFSVYAANIDGAWVVVH